MAEPQLEPNYQKRVSMVIRAIEGGGPPERTLDERDRFNLYVAAKGTLLEQPRVEFADVLGPDGQCWTAAWEEAKYRGGDYVEGMALTLGGRLYRAHAWVERVDSDGNRYVVEATEGYRDIATYLGYPMSARPDGPADTVTRHFGLVDGGRYSVIEWLLVSGWAPTRIDQHLSSPEVSP